MKHSKLLKGCIFPILVLTGWLIDAHGQTVIPEKRLGEADQEDLAQIETLNEEARVLFGEAKTLYKQLEKMEGESKGKAKDAKAKQLKQKALKKDIEGFEKKKMAHRHRYQIYERHLKQFQADARKHSARLVQARLFHEDAKKLFYRASILRNEAYNHVKGQQGKFSKLEKAHNIEQLALKKFRRALELYDQTKKKAGAGSSNVSPNERVVIDHELLEAIQSALEAYEPGETLYGKINHLSVRDTVSYSMLDTLLDQYRSGAWSGKRDTALVQNGQIAARPARAKDTAGREEGANPGARQKNGGGNKDTTNQVLPELSYRVQIATDRQSLPQGALRKLYDGDKKIYRVDQGGWKKYMIGAFSSYNQASRFRKDLDVEESFIVAFRDDKKVSPESLEAMAGKTDASASHQAATPVKNTAKRTTRGDTSASPEKTHSKSSRASAPKDGSNSINASISTDASTSKDASTSTNASASTDTPAASKKLIFRVQIAANRVQLKKKALSSIYSGVKEITLNRNKGWYRYSIGHCPSYYHAKRLNNHTPVKGSWVVAYRDGKRINAYRVRKPIYTYANPTIRDKGPARQGLVFKVQIAASTLKLREHDLKYIYAGKRPVTEIKQGKYYKYSIGQFNTFGKAVELQKKVCVPGAFVVAFDKGKPVDVRTAKKRNK